MLTSIYLIILVLTAFIICYYLINRRNDIPGPTLYQLIKLVLQSKSYADALENIVDLNKIYGPVLNLSFWPMSPIIMTTSVEAIEQILNSKDHLDKPAFYEAFKMMLGEGIASTSAHKWKPQRKQINLAMGQDFINRLFWKTDIYINKFIEKVNKSIDQPIDVESLLNENLIDVIVASLSKCPDLNNEDYKIFLKAKKDLIQLIIEKLTSIHMLSGFLYKYTSNYKRLIELRNTFVSLGRRILAYYRNNNNANNESDFVQCLLNAGMEEDIIIDNIITIIEAGHDTTSTTLAFGLYELSKHPVIQNRLYEEIKNVLGDDANRDITPNELKELTYLDCFIKETLRCSAVVSFIGRRAGVDVNIKGYTVPKGSTIIIPINALHHIEKYFKDPDTFNPDRFLDDVENETNEFALMAFSAGPRNCLGKAMAMQQLKLGISKIIRNFEILPHNYKMECYSAPLRKSYNGVYVNFKKRI